MRVSDVIAVVKEVGEATEFTSRFSKTVTELLLHVVFTSSDALSVPETGTHCC